MSKSNPYYRHQSGANVISSFFGAAKATMVNRKSSVSQGSFAVFEDISQKTGAYVKAPTYTQMVICTTSII